MNVKMTLLLSLLIFSLQGFSQTLESFILMGENGQPLEGATFEYVDQQGITDDSGELFFNYVEGAEMKMSFLGYGTWTMNDSQIQDAISENSFQVKMQQQNILPITIIALRPKMGEEDITEFGYQERIAHDAGEILTQSAAISGIRKSGNYGTDPVLRGFKYDQINIVMNGTQCATAACPNRMDPPTSQMAPNMVDRVEIFKGPFALRYGGGLGATINFASDPIRFEDSGFKGRASGRYDANGNSYRSEAMLGWNGSWIDVSVLGSFSAGNDYRDGADQTIQSDFNRNSLGVQSAVKLSNRQTVEFSAFHNWANDVDFPALMMDLRTDETTMFNASHRISFSDGPLQDWNTTLFASSVDHLMDNLLKPLNPRMVNARTDANTLNLGGRTEGLWQWNSSKLYVGGDFKKETAEGIRTREMLMGPMAGRVFTDNAWQHGSISKSGLFTEYTLRKGGWSVVGAGRLEINFAEILSPDDYFSEQYEDASSLQINPSISFGAIKSINENLSFGAWIARAQRSASLTERYINRFPVGNDPYELMGDPNLDPEINNQMELTLEYKTQRGILKLDLFTSYMQDYITSFIDPDLNPIMMNRPGVRRFQNLDHAVKAGFELGFSQDLTPWLCQKADVAYTYAQNTTNGDPLPEIAPLDLRYKMCGHLLQNKIHGEISFRHVLAQDRVSAEFGESASPSFSTLDLEMSYDINKYGNVAVGVENILDEEYAEHLSRSTLGMNAGSLNARGRNIYLMLNVMF